MLYLFIKNDKQPINNNRPASFLPIIGKLSERVVFNNIYEYLDKRNVLNPIQSNFGFNDSVCTVYQLLQFAHNIFSPFDCNPTLKTRAAFLGYFGSLW